MALSFIAAMGPKESRSTTLTPEEAIIVTCIPCRRPADISTAYTLELAARLFFGHLQPRASAG